MSSILDARAGLRRASRIASLALAAMALAACGDDSEPAEGDEQLISSSGGSGGGTPSGGSGGGDSSGSGGGTPPASSGGDTSGGSGGDTQVVSNLSPWISGSPPRQAMTGQQYSFRPTAGDPEGDPLSFRAINLPRWAVFSTTNGRLSGAPTAADAGRYANVDIEVSDGRKTSRLGSFTIDVVVTASGSITVSWMPATQREDGSALTNIQGHKIHWGTSAGNYTSSVLVQGGGITAYVIENLLPASYYIAASTVDANGLESALSSPMTVTVQ